MVAHSPKLFASEDKATTCVCFSVCSSVVCLAKSSRTYLSLYTTLTDGLTILNEAEKNLENAITEVTIRQGTRCRTISTKVSSSGTNYTLLHIQKKTDRHKGMEERSSFLSLSVPNELGDGTP